MILKKLQVTSLTLQGMRGYSLIEIMVVIGAISVLIGMVSVNLLQAKGQADISTTTNVLISDIRGQQIKAMVGDTEGRETADRYGIYFESDSYTLFHGSTYNASDPQNFEVELAEELVFAQINLPSSQIVFEIGDGSVISYDEAQNSVVLRHLSTEQEEEIQINKYGVVVSEH